MRTLAVLLAAGVVVAVAGCSPAQVGGSGPTPPRPPGAVVGPFPVTRVVDGDTVKVRRGSAVLTVRLVGVDTPETKDPHRPVQCFGVEASARANTLLRGRQVWLEYDPSQGRHDRYGRDLAYVWVGATRTVNEELIREGYGREYTYDRPYRYRALFQAAERSARSAGRGLWAAAACAGGVTRVGQHGMQPLSISGGQVR